MGIIEMEPVCETALLAVLPVFRLTVADDEPNAIVRVTHIDNASRKLMSFRAQFLAELDRAYELIQKLLDSISGGRSSFMDDDEYGDNLIKLLRLFDKYISDNVPGFDHRNALRYGDERFPYLGALHRFTKTLEDDHLAMALGYITLGRSVSNHNRNLKRIQKFNRKLAGFLGDPASIETANLLDKRAKVSRSPSYEIRSQVCKLHEVLSDSWGKTCRMSHRTNLGLSAFRDRLPDQSCLLEKWEAYILIASHENPDVWQQNKIRVVDSAPEAPKGRVTFTNVQAKAKPLFLARTAPRRIENICSTTGIPNAWQSCLHVEARNDVLWRAAMGALKDYLPLSVQTPTVSLRNLIKSRRKLSTKAKLIIAVLVAHAMLHLSESPWLDRQFLDKDLCFCQMTSRGVDISHPYLTTKFPANDEEPLPEADSPPHPYSSLLGLGIILIELHTEKLIESYHSPDDLIGGKQNLSSDMTAAHRLATTKDAWDVNQRYRSAVQACLEPTILGEIETEIQFQQAIYSQIVAPLEFEAFEAYGITEDMLYDPFYLTEDMSSNPFHLPMSETRVVMANTPITSSTGSNRPREPRVDNEEGESDDNQEDRVYDVLLLPESKADKEKVRDAKKFFQRLKKIQTLLASGRTDNFVPIKVAILDTGIRQDHPLRPNLKGYYDFVDENFVEGETPARDDTGHGSDMVDLLHKTAPGVSIFVARVFAKNTGSDRYAICAAKAIDYARKLSVDIISMSFGFVKNHKVLEAAINDTNILMFAASTNFGAVEDSPIRFPARMKHKVICIHAADGIGDPSRGNPGSSSKQRNFSILGECVFIRNELDPASQKLLPVYESGTSVATPIAAGVATLVLEFSQQDGLHQKVEDKEALKSFAGMSAVLRRMSKAGRKSGFDFIEPSKVLDIGVGADEREQMGHVCAKISEALSGRYDWEE